MTQRILRHIINTTVLLMIIAGSHAQVIIEEPQALQELVDEYAELNKSRDEINGWSILVTLNRDRRQMEKIEMRFKYHFPDLREFVSWRFEDPYYKLIVGAFPDRVSSLPLLERIREKFSGAFEVKNDFPPNDIMEFRRASYKYILENY